MSFFLRRKISYLKKKKKRKGFNMKNKNDTEIDYKEITFIIISNH